MKAAKTLLYHGAMVCLVVLGVELASSLLLYVYARATHPRLVDEGLRPATLVIVRKSLARLFPGRFGGAGFEKLAYLPRNPVRPDADQGYGAAPGSYVARYTRRTLRGLEHLDTGVTINADGTRFTGLAPPDPERAVHVFGDSFVFGEGVNDAQTFTALLQGAFPRAAFHLHALPSYSLTNACVEVRKLAPAIRPQDVLVVGYAAFYKERHVAAPSRLRAIQAWIEERYPGKALDPNLGHLRATLAAGQLKIDKVPFYCQFNRAYCQQPDPAPREMDEVTVELLRLIARETKARILLLHFDGPRDDPVLARLPGNVELVRATTGDFDSFIRDDIVGFDEHPGPYWHHAMYSRLRQALQRPGP